MLAGAQARVRTDLGPYPPCAASPRCSRGRPVQTISPFNVTPSLQSPAGRGRLPHARHFHSHTARPQPHAKARQRRMTALRAMCPLRILCVRACACACACCAALTSHHPLARSPLSRQAQRLAPDGTASKRARGQQQLRAAMSDSRLLGPQCAESLRALLGERSAHRCTRALAARPALVWQARVVWLFGAVRACHSPAPRGLNTGHSTAAARALMSSLLGSPGGKERKGPESETPSGSRRARERATRCASAR